MGWETAGDAALLALFSFAVQILLVFLRGGSSVRARIVPNHAQDHLLNYEIRNAGNVTAEDVLAAGRGTEGTVEHGGCSGNPAGVTGSRVKRTPRCSAHRSVGTESRSP